VLRVDSTYIEIIFGEATNGIKVLHLNDLIDELYKVICHTTLLTNINAGILSNALMVCPINYNRFQLVHIDGSNIGIVVYSGSVRDEQIIANLYLFNFTNAGSVEKELSKCKCDRLDGILYNSRSTWAVSFANIKQMINVLANNL